MSGLLDGQAKPETRTSRRLTDERMRVLEECGGWTGVVQREGEGGWGALVDQLKQLGLYGRS